MVTVSGKSSGRRTKLMKDVQRRFDGRELIDVIVEGMNEKGLSQTAEDLGVSKATLGYWMLKMNIQVKRVALRPGETLQIVRPQQ